MKTQLFFDKFLIYSEVKCFFTSFSDGINVVTGKNTSGKSTMLQSILYAMGINDVKHNLHELLSENVIFRLDCRVDKGVESTKVSFIRDDSILTISAKGKIHRFNGINGDNSAEHIKLKKYLSRLFDFDLLLENKGDLKDAPIETMFLPYYISQSVGWVYLRKSFSNLDYFKNFKDDYIDYYLGIIKPKDRVNKSKLEKQLQQVRIERNFYETMKNDDIELISSELNNEEFVNEAQRYLDEYNVKKKELKIIERNHTNACNNLSLLEQRQSVLRKVSKSLKNQSPVDGSCPTCHRKFDFVLEEYYEYQQNMNDTDKQKEEHRKRISKEQSTVNSSMKKMINLRKEIEKMYTVVKDYQKLNIRFNDWLDSKASIKLRKKVKLKVSDLQEKEDSLIELIRKFKTDDDVKNARLEKEKSFKIVFNRNLDSFGVKHLEGERYNNLYRISSFPSQGVELHKTIMSYHFAFNEIVKESEDIHRFPFILDAVFKEDIETENRNMIYGFIKNYRPVDTQIIFSVAFTDNEQDKIEKMSMQLGHDIKIITVGNLTHKRSLLYEPVENHLRLIDETNDLMVEV